DGRGAGAPVVDKSQRALRNIFYVGTDVRSVEDEGCRLVLFVFQQQAADGGLVGDGLTRDFDEMIGGGRFFFGSRCGRFRRFFGGFYFLLLGDAGGGRKSQSECGGTQQGQSMGADHAQTP